MSAYFFDACALIALADDEEGADILENYLADVNNQCFVHSLNLCEVYYHAHRNGTENEAQNLIKDFLEIGLIERNDLDTAFWQEAGNIKAIHKKVSLADCCAIALAKRLDATLITSDHHELDELADKGVCKVSFFR
ncbi:MAG: PIN domain-containing protein [Pyrinomonadaceae bacterium]|nr:PIN domain-containing protein [Pyrinomonadaceae bacterium]